MSIGIGGSWNDDNVGYWKEQACNAEAQLVNFQREQKNNLGKVYKKLKEDSTAKLNQRFVSEIPYNENPSLEEREQLTKSLETSRPATFDLFDLDSQIVFGQLVSYLEDALNIPVIGLSVGPTFLDKTLRPIDPKFQRAGVGVL